MMQSCTQVCQWKLHLQSLNTMPPVLRLTSCLFMLIDPIRIDLYQSIRVCVCVCKKDCTCYLRAKYVGKHQRITWINLFVPRKVNYTLTRPTCTIILNHPASLSWTIGLLYNSKAANLEGFPSLWWCWSHQK